MKKVLILLTAFMITFTGCTSLKDLVKTKINRAKQEIKEDIKKYDQVEIRILVNKGSEKEEYFVLMRSTETEEEIFNEGKKIFKKKIDGSIIQITDKVILDYIEKLLI